MQLRFSFGRFEDTLWGVPSTSKKADFAEFSFHAESFQQACRGTSREGNAAWSEKAK
ncbi:hypothetical protein [Paenibacillus amylolyticus]|uniref:hypothetical protein n=1 Tax=Paenibacillus amylolyticus TaxID=1451 RepID=UPI0013E3B61D|nr:hypothetical protein [Paenibacillus amylolyticus]